MAYYGLYRFECDFGGMGDLEGLFVANHEDIDSIIGKRIYFGEVLGKHSEIWIDSFSEDHITLLTEDEAFIDKLIELGLETGFNPLDYGPEDEEDEDDE